MIEMKCCDILGTRILVTNMADTVERIEHDMEELRGKYICVGNVHTTVMAHDDAHYHEVQKSAAFVLPDGKPLSVYSRKHGFPEAERVTGPDLMLELFTRENGLKHYFYGGSPETLEMLEQKLRERYSTSSDCGDGIPAVPQLKCGGGCGGGREDQCVRRGYHLGRTPGHPSRKTGCTITGIKSAA